MIQIIPFIFIFTTFFINESTYSSFEVVIFIWSFISWYSSLIDPQAQLIKVSTYSALVVYKIGHTHIESQIKLYWDSLFNRACIHILTVLYRYKHINFVIYTALFVLVFLVAWIAVYWNDIYLPFVGVSAVVVCLHFYSTNIQCISNNILAMCW